MTIVEVIVAITILGVLAAASLGVFLAGTAASLAQQRRQLAVTLANAALETSARCQPRRIPSSASAYSSAVGTRTPLRRGGPPMPEWRGPRRPIRAGIRPRPPASVPTLHSTTRRRATPYFTVDTLLGTCYLPQTRWNLHDLTGHSTPPEVVSRRIHRNAARHRHRAMGGRQVVRGRQLHYSAVTLVDVNSDLDWNTHD